MYYEEHPKADTLYQGDVLDRFIFPDPPDDTLIARSSAEDVPPLPAGEERPFTIVRVFKQGLLPDAFSTNREAIVTTATRIRAAIISQSCDIQWKPFVTVAAVRAMTSLSSEGKKKEVREDKRFDVFWLPASAHLEESFIDFNLLLSLPGDALKKLLPNRILSLSISSRQQLQWKLMRFFGRPATD
jgi:hypothetical protein